MPSLKPEVLRSIAAELKHFQKEDIKSLTKLPEWAIGSRYWEREKLLRSKGLREGLFNELRVVPEKEYERINDISLIPQREGVAGRYNLEANTLEFDPFQMQPGTGYHEFAHARQFTPLLAKPGEDVKESAREVATMGAFINLSQDLPYEARLIERHANAFANTMEKARPEDYDEVFRATARVLTRQIKGSKKLNKWLDKVGLTYKDLLIGALAATGISVASLGIPDEAEAGPVIPKFLEKQAAKLAEKRLAAKYALFDKAPEVIERLKKSSFEEVAKLSRQDIVAPRHIDEIMDTSLKNMERNLAHGIGHEKAFTYDISGEYKQLRQLRSQDRAHVLVALMREEGLRPEERIISGMLTKRPYERPLPVLPIVGAPKGFEVTLLGDALSSISHGESLYDPMTVLKNTKMYKDSYRTVGGWNTFDFSDRIKKRLDWLVKEGYATREGGRVGYYKSTDKARKAIKLLGLGGLVGSGVLFANPDDQAYAMNFRWFKNIFRRKGAGKFIKPGIERMETVAESSADKALRGKILEGRVITKVEKSEGDWRTIRFADGSTQVVKKEDIWHLAKEHGTNRYTDIFEKKENPDKYNQAMKSLQMREKRGVPKEGIPDIKKAFKRHSKRIGEFGEEVHGQVLCERNGKYFSMPAEYAQYLENLDIVTIVEKLK